MSQITYVLRGSLLALCVVVSFGLSAQRTVSGTVTDVETGEALIGANILAKGTSAGTTTDIDGSYSLEVPDDATTLVVSYIGYVTQEVEIGASNVVDVSLQSGSVLDEVVVVGYGTVKKRDATGAVATLKAEDFNVGVINSPEQLIQGRAPGVQITSSSGEPGAGVNIRIRGTSSVRSNNNPLFVVDGVPLNSGSISAGGSDSGAGVSSARNPLNFINPADIESIDILKDASATAIYGSRGANGVVLITTKSGLGKAGQGVSYSGNVGFSEVTRRYDLLSADEYRSALSEIGANVAELDQGADTDWQDEIFRTALTTEHNLAFGGGSDNSSYRFSFGYLNQDGVVENSGMTRYTGRLNSTHTMWDDRITINTFLTVANVLDQNPLITNNSGFEGDLLGAALIANPTQPVFDADGEYIQPGVDRRNPVAILDLSSDNTNTLRVLGSVSAGVKITDNLTYRFNLGMDRSQSQRRFAASPDLVFGNFTGRGYARFDNNLNSSTLLEHTLNFSKDIGSSSSIDLLAGMSYQEFTVQGDYLQATEFRVSDVQSILNNLQSSDIGKAGNQNRIGSFREKDELQSFFGRVNYNISDKYLLTATVRADGSTKFGENNRYGIFPSAAFAWRLIDEPFFPENLFYDFKLRVGYGVTGNQEIPNGLAIRRQRYGDNGALNDVSFGNPDLQWESTEQLNIGIDFGLSKGRILGTLDFFRSSTNNLLIRQFSAQPAPTPFTWLNLTGADVINSGVELGLGIVAVEKADFRWNIDYNFTYIDNIVEGDIGLINTGEVNGQGLTGAFAQRIADGQPLYSYYLRTFEGFDAEGFNIYADNEAVTFVDKSPLPDFTMGLSNSIVYKNWDFNFFFNAVFGTWVYNNTANAFFTKGALANGRNVTKDVVTNGESNINAPDASTRFLEDASFIRLQNMSLGYSIPVENSKVFQSLRFYITAQNLFTITEYTGQDPEVDTNKALNDVPSLGMDYTAYPRARTILFGVNTTF